MSSKRVSEDRHQPAATRVYRTDAIEVTWNPAVCAHFGACFDGSIEAFDPRRRPWIEAGAEPPERIAEIVSHCPTGALHVRWLDGRPPVEPPDEPVAIMPQRDGPLLVRGRMLILDREGRVVREDTRMALCRCGHSENKPFCDDSHYHVGFESNDPQYD